MSLLDVTRRHFFRQAGFGLGAIALASLLDERLFAADTLPEAAGTARAALRADAPSR